MIAPTLVCCLEEPSAREMLTGVLTRILPTGWNVQYIVFEGKQVSLSWPPRPFIGNPI